jgi:glycerol uptake facilitator-like aquaporin
MPLGRKLAVEFVGTFSLVFTVGMATNSKTGAGAVAPLAIGAALMVYIIANLLGGAAAASAFLYVQPAEEASGEIDAARASD